ncbi:MAG: AraC family transcriptional regulator [Bacteroidetes bacterium]|nr:AraC family transcriptional regulator [Bacteroidota bacterium]
MEDFFKYINPGQEDKDWGLFLNCAGKASIKPGLIYPPTAHPSGYYFTYENGRTLNEYQINYITDGAGVFENQEGKFKVCPGSLIFTRPGEWHRYKPTKSIGWVEQYVGFSGYIAHQMFGRPWFTKKNSVVEVGNSEEIIDTYFKIFNYTKEEKPGYQQVAAGMIMKLLGFIVSMDKQKDFSGKRVEKIIQNACFTIRENVEAQLNFQLFAEENNIGYSYFRKMFKKYTGVPPVQYHLDLKILRAKEMLLYSDKSIKEISYDLGFQSIYYFSRIFKNKLSVSPSEFRKSGKIAHSGNFTDLVL